MREGEADESDRPRTLIYRSGFVVFEEGSRQLNDRLWKNANSSGVKEMKPGSPIFFLPYLNETMSFGQRGQVSRPEELSFLAGIRRGVLKSEKTLFYNNR